MKAGALALALLMSACAPASSSPASSATPSARATPDPSLSGDTLGCLRTFLVLPAARCLDR